MIIVYCLYYKSLIYKKFYFRFNYFYFLFFFINYINKKILLINLLKI